MIMLIQKLLDLKHAYIANNHFYFGVAASLKYTELSNRYLNEMVVVIEKNQAKNQTHDLFYGNQLILMNQYLLTLTVHGAEEDQVVI